MNRGEVDISAIRPRSPLPWPPSSRHSLSDSDPGRPRSRVTEHGVLGVSRTTQGRHIPCPGVARPRGPCPKMDMLAQPPGLSTATLVIWLRTVP